MVFQKGFCGPFKMTQQAKNGPHAQQLVSLLYSISHLFNHSTN
jgi:hypothetical protein